MAELLTLKGRGINKGTARGRALVSKTPFAFAHGVDPSTGVISDLKHELRGHKMRGRVFIFPYGKGSTTGSTWILETIRRGNCAAAIINIETEPIIATGVILGELFYGRVVPAVDRLDQNPVDVIRTGDWVQVDASRGLVEVRPQAGKS